MFNYSENKLDTQNENIRNVNKYNRDFIIVCLRQKFSTAVSRHKIVQRNSVLYNMCHKYLKYLIRKPLSI